MEDKGTKLAIASIVLGGISLVCCIVWYIGCIVGIAGLLLYQKSFGRNINSVPVYCIAAIMAFVIFAALTYGIVGVLCVLITGIFGVVQAYQGVILSAIVLAIVGWAVFSSWKK